MEWHFATSSLSLLSPRILGIVNVTPDSFSDGGLFRSVDAARRRIGQLVDEGADVIDIGGESTRPQGAVAVDADEELRRVIPVVAAAASDHPGLPISIDTVKSRVAEEAIAAGASIVNDVSGFRLDPRMGAVCAAARVGVVLMHSRGDVADMATFAHAIYGDDPVAEIVGELHQALDRALGAGVARENVVIDPGIGFAKRGETSVAVLRQLARVAAIGVPVLVGVSRKRFIGEITGVTIPNERVEGSIGANVAALAKGARLFRVHDVRQHRHALDVAWSILRTDS
jgi:dihydropteroate synthase